MFAFAAHTSSSHAHMHTLLYTHTNDTHNDKDIIYPQILGPRCAVKICYSMFCLLLVYIYHFKLFYFYFTLHFHFHLLYSPEPYIFTLIRKMSITDNDCVSRLWQGEKKSLTNGRSLVRFSASAEKPKMVSLSQSLWNLFSSVKYISDSH